MQTADVSLQDGDESYPLYKKEKEGLLASLKKRATMIENVSFACMQLITSWTVFNILSLFTMFLHVACYALLLILTTPAIVYII